MSKNSIFNCYDFAFDNGQDQDLLFWVNVFFLRLHGSQDCMLAKIDSNKCMYF